MVDAQGAVKSEVTRPGVIVPPGGITDEPAGWLGQRLLAAPGEVQGGLRYIESHAPVFENGEHRGVGLAPVNWSTGTQSGLMIGIVNYTHTLQGVQLGLVNIVRDNGLARVLPLFNVGR